MPLDNAVDDGDVLVWHLVHDDVANLERARAWHGQEEEVASLRREGG